jgi:hypothetical protein
MKPIPACYVLAAFLTAVAPAAVTPQDEQPGRAYSFEGGGRIGVQRYLVAHRENFAQLKLQLLDAWVRDYPDSPLMPYAYRDYYLAYFSLRDYVRAIAYADKQVALGDKVDVASRLEALAVRAQSFLSACGPAFQTPDAFAQADTAATLGKQLLGQWNKTPAIAEAQFAARKKRLDALFDSIVAIGKNGGKTGDRPCKPPDPSSFGDLAPQIPPAKVAGP